jgi:hypothetical protein
MNLEKNMPIFVKKNPEFKDFFVATVNLSEWPVVNFDFGSYTKN